MELAVLTVIVFAVFGIMEIKPLIKSNNRKTLYIYLSIYAVSFCIVLLASLDIRFAGTNKILSDIVRAVTGKS